MPDVIIHRCRVRVLRRDGWSWGPAPRELVDQVVRWLPQVLAGRLAEFAIDGDDVEVTAPVVVTIPIRLAQLGKAPAIAIDAEPSMVPHRTPRAAANETRPAAQLLADAGVEPSPPRTFSQPVDRTATQVAATETTALSQLIRTWHSRGCLGILLRRLTPHTLVKWHDALAPPKRAAEIPASTSEDPRFELAVRAALANLGPAPAEHTRRLLCRIVIAAESGAALARDLDDVELWKAIERLLPTDEPSNGASIENPRAHIPTGRLADLNAESKPGEVPLRDEPSLTKSAPRLRPACIAGTPLRTTSVASTPPVWDVHVGSALPFLMLGPLARIGFFDAVAATLEIEELADAWPTFAAALASKALERPDAYGRRSPQAQRDAAAFAASAVPIAETAFTALAERTRGKLSALEAVIAHALLSGHMAGQPLLLHGLDGRAGWLLVETAGAFPVACVESAVALLDWYALVDAELLLVPRSAADPALMRALNEAGVRFVTDAPPLRSDSWRCLREGKDRWWTNGATTARAALLRSARLLDNVEESVHSTWKTLGLDRRAAPRVPGSDLDRLLTLAAAFALGQLAWSLWREREATDPLLALERFASLDARVFFRADEVRVTLPMGRRTWDLAEHRLTGDVWQLPWLGGRTVTFSMG